MDIDDQHEALVLPDLRSAILETKMSMERDPDKRVVALNKRRSETYAIRDLFKAAQANRVERADQEYRNQYLYPFRKCDADRPFRPTFLRRPASCIDDKTRQLFPDIQHQISESAPNSASYRRREQAIPYHTAITLPPDKRSRAETFKALTCHAVRSLPHIYETTHHHALPGYSSRDIREWKDEIKKIVPARLPLFLPAHAVPRSLSVIVPPEIERSKDSLCFFRPTVDKMAGKGKEYMINPEWPSEKYGPDSARSRAKCVYTWNV